MGHANIVFEVIVGTYEEFVLGYQYTKSDQNVEKSVLIQTFATHSHRASVRCVASKGQLVVSGGADETINIYNMFTRKECGMLMEHNGTITSLSFTPDCSHLISTSEDGSIKIFRQGSWMLEKVWPSAHKGTAVTYLSVHPSGKMALSVGKDHTLRTWNLVKGRPAYITNLYSRCRQLEHVVWSPGGELFAIPMDCKVEITSTEKGGVINTLTFSSKVSTCSFLSDEVLCVGESSGVVNGICTNSSDQLWSLPGDQRVRGLQCLHSHLVTATSTGKISVYTLDDLTKQPKLITSVETACRITCLTLFDYKSVFKVKKDISKDKKSKSHSRENEKGKRKISLEEDGKKETSTNSKKKKKSVNSPVVTHKLEDSQVVICSPRNQKWIVESSKR